MNPAFGESQFLTPKKLAWVMDVGESTVADWLRSERGRPPLIAHFRQGRLIRIEPSEAWRFVLEHTLQAKRQNAEWRMEPLRVELAPAQFAVLGNRLERLIQVRLAELGVRNELGRAA